MCFHSCLVTDLGRGDPDLFINIAPPNTLITPSMFPNMTNNPTWQSRRIGSESISIPPTDPNYRSQALYLISVSGDAHDAYDM